MTTYNFEERLHFSKGQLRESHMATIAAMIDGCLSVRATTEREDRKGADYIATLPGGRTVAIDVKTRSRGCSRYWTDGEPDLALEIWSKRPTDNAPGTVGWTLDPSKTTEYVLFTYDLTDCPNVYLVAFQSLRFAFRRHQGFWRMRYGKPDDRDVQHSTSFRSEWQSECVFVPANVVLDAIRESSIGWTRGTSALARSSS